MVKVGDIVHAEYNNGEVVDGEVVKVRHMGQEGGEVLTWADGKMMDSRTLVTVKTEQGYRSIYLDKCVKFLILQAL